jgi:chromosome segregation ATPase
VDPIDELFALPPEQFTAARDALAKRLKAEGNSDASAAVKKLARPTVAAWALNQLPHQHPEVVEEVVAAGAELRRAQRRALSGIADAGMSAATQDRREAVRNATDAAARILSSAGREPATVERDIQAALEAATNDPAIAEELQEGRFSKPPALEADLGGLMALSLAAAGEPETVPPPSKARDDPQERRRREHERKIDEARQRATATSRVALEAEARAEAAAEQAESAQAEADDLNRQAAAATKRARELVRAAKAAREDADRQRAAAKETAEKLAALERE